MTHPSVKTCVCGHLQADHASARTPLMRPVLGGICLIDGCDCQEFADASASSPTRSLPQEPR